MPKTDMIESKSALHDVQQWLTDRQADMIEQVRELVVRESPTHDKHACDALCSYLAQQFEALGGRVKIHHQPEAGNHLQVEFAGPRGRKRRFCCWGITTPCTTSEPWRPCPGSSRTAACMGPAYST